MGSEDLQDFIPDASNAEWLGIATGGMGIERKHTRTHTVLVVFGTIQIHSGIYPRTQLTSVLIGKDHILAPKQGFIRF